ncbi:MAG: hypothetical protein PUE01_00195 [Clostridiaceae bacterium]|nr:hypothetical protein [Clostridiaceae bacterium]
MGEIWELKREVHGTLKLISSKKYVSMVSNAFDVEREGDNENILYFKNKNIKEHERTALRLLELWKDIDKTGESYFFIIDPEKKLITAMYEGKLQVMDMYTPRGIKIFMKYFFVNTSSIVYYYGVTLPEELKDSIEFIYDYDKDKQEQVMDDLIEKLENKLQENADIYDEKMKDYEGNREWFEKQGNFLDTEEK